MSKLTFLLLAPLAQLCSSAAVDKEAEDAKALSAILPQHHYSQPAIDDAFSQKMLTTYLDLLDPAKLYFEVGDIARLTEQFSHRLDDDLRQGDLSCAAIVTTILKTRMQERSAWIDQLCKEPIDFSLDESLPQQVSNWQTHEEALDYWRKIYKNAVIGQLLNKASEEDARKQARLQQKRRFSRMLKLSEDDAEAIILNASVRTCDPHSDYMPAPNADAYQQSLSNTFFGIGVELKLEPSNVYTVVTAVLPGSPASREPAIVPGTQIALVEIAGQLTATDEMDTQELVSYIRGPKGTKVRLGLLPAGTLDISQMKYVELTREAIVQEDGKARAISKEVSGTSLAVITLPSFYEGCANNVSSLLRDHADAKGLILDLRRNGGGYVNQCVQLTGLFIPSGPVVLQDGASYTDWLDKVPSYDARPLVVLVSRYSASASEILAGALQEYERAVIVGSEHTYGKGTVQTIQTLKSQASLKFTISQYFLPSGKSTQFMGVRADIVLPSLNDWQEVGEAYLPNALKSETASSTTFFPLGLVNKDKIALLAAKSAERVLKSPAFIDLQTDLARNTQLSKQPISLNLAKRQSLSVEEKPKENPSDIILEEALNILLDLCNADQQ